MQIAKLVSSWICDTLSNYRMLYVLNAVADLHMLPPQEKKAIMNALRGEAKKVCADADKNYNDAEEAFIAFVLNWAPRIQDWIKYAMLDNAFYLKSVFGNRTVDELDKERLLHYMYRMDQQNAVVFVDRKAFCLHPGDCVVYDFGAGTMPYVPQFYANAQICKTFQYIGIDKNPVSDAAEKWQTIFGSGLDIKTEVGDMRTFTPREHLPMPTVLFFGESLHCTSQPKEVIKNLMANYAKSVKLILILEPDVTTNKGISIAFEYHMLKHCNGVVPNPGMITKLAQNLDMQLNIFPASSQHTMYRLERK